MENTFYEERFKVMSPDSTCLRMIKPSCTLKYFQEMADVHANMIGLGYQKLKDRDMALICYRTSLTFMRKPPRTNEEFVCKTWLRKLKGAQFIRDYTMAYPDGTILAEGTTSWILMDLTQRMAIRPNKVKDLPVITNESLALSSDRLKKVALPDNMEPVDSRKVRYTDLDYFHHLNNCVYADIICDVMSDYLQEAYLTKLDISYINEASLGDIMEIKHGFDGNVHYITGDIGESRCFEASVEIQKQ